MIKKSLVIAAVSALIASPAFADVSGLSAKFAGGCKSSNTSGDCTIKVTATGDTEGESALLKYAATSKGPFTKLSNRTHSLSGGSATFRFKNKAGCYKAETGPNGNDKPDVSSRAICE